jgi:hypothetical protein
LTAAPPCPRAAPGTGRWHCLDGVFQPAHVADCLELALHDPLYEDLAIKFFEHTLWIAGAMDRIGDHKDELWDEADGFFYDVLQLPDGKAVPG